MEQSLQLIQTLKQTLRNRGIGYRHLADKINLSESSVKRIFAEQNFTLKRLEEICQAADLSLYELTRLAEQQQPSRQLSLEQEQALADQPILLVLLHMVTAGWSASAIKRRCKFDDPTLIRHLGQLDKLELIDLQPENKVRLRVHWNIDWRANGPIRKLFESRIKSDFLTGNFDRDNQTMEFESLELSEASVKILQRKLQQLMRQYRDLAELDQSLPPIKRRNTGLLLAFKPWVLFAIDESQK